MESTAKMGNPFGLLKMKAGNLLVKVRPFTGQSLPLVN